MQLTQCSTVGRPAAVGRLRAAAVAGTVVPVGDLGGTLDGRWLALGLLIVGLLAYLTSRVVRAPRRPPAGAPTVHARATGPPSAVSVQTLGGRATRRVRVVVHGRPTAATVTVTTGTRKDRT